MTTPNPYQAPNADISTSSSETYQPKVFSTQGRIGRVRYLAYCLASYLILIPFAMIGGIIAGVSNMDSETSAPLVTGIVFLGYIPMLIFIFILAKRRLNDMDKSGWLSLLMFVPLINIFISLWLLFGKGNQGSNKFGPAPCENSAGTIIAAWVAGAIIPLAILAAVAIPAYQDYVERAQEYSR